MKNVLILGANGFIGTYLRMSLEKELDINLSLFSRNFNNEDKLQNVKYFTGDFNNQEDISKALEQQDIVYHVLTQSTPPSTYQNPSEDIYLNLIPFINFLDLCSQKGVKKVVMCSSGGTIYGPSKDPVTELDLTNPLSPYAIVKQSMENFLKYAKNRYGINYDIYRIANPYGAYQRNQGVLSAWMNSILEDQPILLLGDGQAVRDYIHATDVAKLMGLSITKDIEDCDTYNIGSHKGRSLLELLQALKEVTNKDFKINHQDQRSCDLSKIVLNSNKILTHFPDHSFIDINDGIEEMWNYYKQNFKSKKS